MVVSIYVHLRLLEATVVVVAIRNVDVVVVNIVIVGQLVVPDHIEFSCDQ